VAAIEEGFGGSQGRARREEGGATPMTRHRVAAAFATGEGNG